MRDPHSISRGLCSALASALVAVALAGGSALAQSDEELIEEQQETEVLTDDLIGMNIYSENTDAESPEHIGAVESLLLDEENQLTGVVVSVGGFLGFGAKSVALDWDAIEVREWDTASYGGFVQMTRADLEEAPAFKTLAEKKAEEEAERAREQMEQQQQQTGTGTGTGTAN